jgi:hypothetical protein
MSLDNRVNDPNDNGVFGGNDSTTTATATDKVVGNGVFGFSNVPNASGVFGANNNGGTGVAGIGHLTGDGVAGTADNGFGVVGRNATGFAAVHGHGGKNGVWGFTTSANDSGVFGQNDGSGNGVAGSSKDGFGVVGRNETGFAAVHGHGGKNGVWGFSSSANDSGVFGQNDGSGNGVAGFSQNGIGLFGKGGSLAGRFEGDVEVTGHLKGGDLHCSGNINAQDVLLAGGDCAEDFDIAGIEQIEPGTVMMINDEGTLQQSKQAYDKRVAGVISGAGNLKPGIVLDKQPSQHNRMPIALLGKVYCKADAQYGSIEAGDLLTTSLTSGHAMRVSDPFKALGAIIGKALQPLTEGQGLIPILITLQ